MEPHMAWELVHFTKSYNLWTDLTLSGKKELMAGKMAKRPEAQVGSFGESLVYLAALRHETMANSGTVWKASLSYHCFRRLGGCELLAVMGNERRMASLPWHKVFLVAAIRVVCGPLEARWRGHGPQLIMSYCFLIPRILAGLCPCCPVLFLPQAS